MKVRECAVDLFDASLGREVEEEDKEQKDENRLGLSVCVSHRTNAVCVKNNVLFFVNVTSL